jgi:fructoselysine-6-P-deglycase FrlB-like protein
MGKKYSEEISAIPNSIAWAISQDAKPLTRAIGAVADENLLVIGSGGSFSVAAYAALLHELHFGRMARAATPLEAITFQGAQRSMVRLYLSAEGCNKDILAAARAGMNDETGAIALTMTMQNPLVAFCNEYGLAQPISFDMPWKKDGYLATNSLVAMMVIIARAYRVVDATDALSQLDPAWFAQRRAWYAQSDCVARLACGAELIALFGQAGRIGAIDLESKFAEAALGVCQVTDYRQFAHGRHLQLSVRPLQVIVAFGSDADQALVDASLSLVPESTLRMRIPLPEDPVVGEIIAVIETMMLVEAVARSRSIDVGQPDVRQFGRDMYAMDAGGMYARNAVPSPMALSRKVPSHGPKDEQRLAWKSAALDFCGKLRDARIKAVICDFDGTCCDTALRYDGIDSRLLEHVNRLLHSGVSVAFASGRGDSLQLDLRSKIEKGLWPGVMVGYYSGAIIADLSENFCVPTEDDRLVALRDWLVEHGLIDSVDSAKVRGGQLGVGAPSKGARLRIAAAARYWLGSNMCLGWRVYCSGHSVDVLTEHVGKCRVVEAVRRRTGSTDESELLRIGDSGQFEGNDFELLACGLGLSVAAVSPLRSSCWNFLPAGMRGVAGMKYYLDGLVAADGVAHFDDAFVTRTMALVEENKGRE